MRLPQKEGTQMPVSFPPPQTPDEVPPHRATKSHEKPQPHRAGAKRSQTSLLRCTNLHENARFQKNAFFAYPSSHPLSSPELSTPHRVQPAMRNLLTAAAPVLAAALSF